MQKKIYNLSIQQVSWPSTPYPLLNSLQTDNTLQNFIATLIIRGSNKN